MLWATISLGSGYSMRVSTSRFYVEHYGMFWSMNRTQFEELLRLGASGTGYDLDILGKRTNYRTTRNPDDDRPAVIRKEHIIISPLDWDADEFGRALDDLLHERWEELKFGY